MGILFSDNFSAGSIGGSWAVRGGTWSQAGGVVSQTSQANVDPVKRLQVEGISFPAELEVSARVRVDSWAGGDYARVGIGLGADSSGTGFDLLFHNNTSTVQFLWNDHDWGASASFTWAVGSWYRFRFRQQGGTLYGKVWADGATEPGSWMLTDTSWPTWVTVPGAPGLAGGCYTGAAASYDDFLVTDLAANAPAGLSSYYARLLTGACP